MASAKAAQEKAKARNEMLAAAYQQSRKWVADAVVRAAPKLPDHNNLMMCFRILNQCADKSHLEAMERLATNPRLSESLQKSFEGWFERLRRSVGS